MYIYIYIYIYIHIHVLYYIYIYEEGSNASIFCASTMPSFLKTLIIQNLKLKCQNKTIGYDLHHFIYARVKNYDMSILF